MDNRTMEDLLDKYLTGSLTGQEQQLLNEKLNDPAYQRELEERIGKELEEHAFEGLEDLQILAAIQDNLREKIDAVRKPTRTIAFYITRIAVAAVFILVVGIGVYRLLTPESTATQDVFVKEQKKQNNSLQPGGNRAVLQLADGTDILLDSAGDGILAQQGQVKIIKLTDGQVFYNATEGKSTELLYNTITTPRGGQYQLALADGSKVWLNAASSLRFPASFNNAERVVELSGEGYFEVAKNSKPFHVTLNGLDVQVLGTHFNVNGYEDEPLVRTTLLEGSVKVAKGMENTVIRTGQQAALNKKGNIAVLDDVDVEKVVAWKNGHFYFKKTDIRSILREVSRWYDVEFTYEGEITETFSGQISRNVNASQLLKILESTEKVHFIINGRTIIVKP